MFSKIHFNCSLLLELQINDDLNTYHTFTKYENNTVKTCIKNYFNERINVLKLTTKDSDVINYYQTLNKEFSENKSDLSLIVRKISELNNNLLKVRISHGLIFHISQCNVALN